MMDGTLGAVPGKESSELKKLFETHSSLEMNYRYVLYLS